MYYHFTWQFCVGLFVQDIKQFTIYLTVLSEFFFTVCKVVESLSYSFALEFYTASKKVDCFAWQFCVEIYTDSKEVDNLPDSFVTSDPKVWLSCPAIQREMNRW